MQKYVVEVTKDNTVTVIASFETKEEAMSFGAEYFKTFLRNAGVLSMSLANVDERNKLLNDSEKLFHVWMG